MMKGKLLFFSVMMGFVLLSSIRVSAENPVDINLELGYDDPEYEGGDPHRSPVLIPHVGIDNYTLTFYTPCDGCTLRLLDDSNNVAFAILIPIGTTSIVLPSYLSGSYQIQIIQECLCFWGYVEL